MKLKEKLNVSIKTFSTWVNIILATLILLGLISSALCNEQKVFRFKIEENSEEGSLASISTTFPPPPTPPSPSSKNVSIPMGMNGMSGIFPALTVTADSNGSRSECGIGALMPWNDNLYMVSYLSVPNAGNGTGLYKIDANFQMTKLADHRSTFANRILHRQTSQIVIGAWIIDAMGNVRVFKDLLNVRVAATAEHLDKPDRLVYMLGMDGPLWECDIILLNCTQLFNLVTELNIPEEKGEQPHFKAAHTMNGRLVVTSNTFEEADFMGTQHGGRLAEWQGHGYNWTILASTAFVEVTGRRNFGQVIYALGWDATSVILKVFTGDSLVPEFKNWQTYRLPKGSHAYDHLWQTEWPRIREVETERYLMDMHGLFYELSPLGWASSTWGLRPISSHLRMVPDFTSFRGFLVLGGNQVSSIFDNNVVTGQSQSGLWFGKTDDLWSFGKPKGWGGVWRKSYVKANIPSDPYLMTGFDHKVLHLYSNEQIVGCGITLQVDVTGVAAHMRDEPWLNYTILYLTSHKPYIAHIFPTGFSAHWVRLVSDSDCYLTGYFHYT